MEYLINLALGVLGSLVAAEIVFRHKIWCRRIIVLAVGRIDDSATRAIKIEEWLAALDETSGVVASFSHAIGCWIGAPAIAAERKPAAVAKNTQENNLNEARREYRDLMKLWDKVAPISASRSIAGALFSFGFNFAYQIGKLTARHPFLMKAAATALTLGSFAALVLELWTKFFKF